MKFFPRVLNEYFFLLLAFACLTSCNKPNNKADLILINGVEPESLDPAVITGEPDGRVVSELFEGLLRFNSKGEVEPGVASSWDISSDHQTYIFHLRPEARWSDGKLVTASDFVASWRRTLQPETGSANCYQLFIVKGAEDFFSGKEKDFSKVGVEALDDQTLKVTLAQPAPYFLDLCAYTTLFPVRVDLIKRVGDHWIKPEQMICNGPYKLAIWRLNDKITLMRNPFYWDAAHVALKKIDLLPISQANVAYNFYATGEADISKVLVPSSLLDEVRKQPDFHAAPSLGGCFLRFNCAKAPFCDWRVRKAFALCIDQKAIAEKIGHGSIASAESFVPPGLPGYQPAQKMTCNPKRARELLAAAGYPEGKGFPLVNYLYTESELDEGIAVELQATWKKELGISVLLARQEWKVYLNSLKNLDYNIGRSSWVADYPDPNNFLEIFTSESGNNRCGWKSKTYDSLIQEASKELDLNPTFAIRDGDISQNSESRVTKRCQLFQQAEEMLINEEMPIIPLFFFMGIEMYDAKKFGGIEENVMDRHPLREIYRKDK